MNRFLQLIVSLGFLLMPMLPLVSQTGIAPFQSLHGAIVRGDTSLQEIALVFTGDEFAEGGTHISRVLANHDIKASFFLTGKFYRNPEFEDLIQTLNKDKHYLGAHSDMHLLYCSWENRDSLLVTMKQFQTDLQDNYNALFRYTIRKEDALYFLPPYEWYNDSIASWTQAMGLQLINYSKGTLSHADYTIPGSLAYRSSCEIFESILDFECNSQHGLNGFILLMHIGTASERTDKFYLYLEKLLEELASRAYEFVRIDELLDQ